VFLCSSRFAVRADLPGSGAGKAHVRPLLASPHRFAAALGGRTAAETTFPPAAEREDDRNEFSEREGEVGAGAAAASGGAAAERTLRDRGDAPGARGGAERRPVRA